MDGEKVRNVSQAYTEFIYTSLHLFYDPEVVGNFYDSNLDRQMALSLAPLSGLPDEGYLTSAISFSLTSPTLYNGSLRTNFNRANSQFVRTQQDARGRNPEWRSHKIYPENTGSQTLPATFEMCAVVNFPRLWELFIEAARLDTSGNYTQHEELLAISPHSGVQHLSDHYPQFTYWPRMSYTTLSKVWLDEGRDRLVDAQRDEPVHEPICPNKTVALLREVANPRYTRPEQFAEAGLSMSEGFQRAAIDPKVSDRAFNLYSAYLTILGDTIHNSINNGDIEYAKYSLKLLDNVQYPKINV
tara:strand:+ start:4994 stop:5893 length:900 start_codon:yes stop_codon:yes gene_type:complete